MDSRVRRFFFFTLLALTTLAFLGLLNVFMIPIFWAVALAIVVEPLNARFAKACGGRGGLASSFTLVGILVLIVLPLLALGVAVSAEVTGLIESIESGEVDAGAPIRWANERLPVLFGYAARFGVDAESLRSGVSNIALVAGRWIAAHAMQIGQNALQFVIGLTLIFYLLFFFLRDGRLIIARLVRVLPLGNQRELHLFARFAEVVRATVKGTFVIAAVEGAIGGAAFAVLGIPGAILWGVIMAVASLIPVVGNSLVWFPAAVLLLVSDRIAAGISLIVVGVLVIGLVDNLLRPILVGRDTRMPDYLVLLATLGGLAWFGISGLVIGPIIAALFVTLWEMFERSFGDEESRAPAPEDGAEG